MIPGCKEEISQILRFANKEKSPCLLGGSATQLAGSTRPHTHGIVFSTDRLNKLETFEDYNFFERGAGCIVLQLAQRLEELGYYLAAHLASRRIAS